MNMEKFLHYYLKIAPIFISISISVFLGLILICSSFYVHEGGHFVFGKFDNLLNGRNSEFEITNWDSCPYFGFFKIPQQIKIIQGYPSLNFKFGGILIVILISTAISIIFYRFTRR